MACASNAPSSLTASLLFEITGDPNYLAWGKRLYDHWYNVAVVRNACGSATAAALSY